MLKRRLNIATSLLSGLFFCILGICFMTNKLEIWNWLYITLVCGLLGMIAIRFFNIIVNYHKVHHRILQFFDVVVWIILSCFSLAEPNLFYSLFPRIIGAWILLHAIVKGIVFTVKCRDHLPGKMNSFFFLIIDLIMAFILLFKPTQYYELISYGIGIYFLIYGGKNLLEFVQDLLPDDYGSVLGKKIQLAIPPWMAAIVPVRLLRMILNKSEEDIAKEEFDTVKADIPVDLEIMMHLAPGGPAMFGHIDLVYHGTVISYGCYDPHERRLFGTLGDGVVIVAPRDEYLINCLENENKTLIVFGIVLNSNQKQIINNRVLEVFGKFVDFQSDEERDRLGLPISGIKDDYISRVTCRVHNAHFYKINQGIFKTFFVLYTNCVSFTLQIVRTIGLDLFDISGIVSPGSYYDFLNHEFKRDKSFVISRKVYTKRDLPDLKSHIGQ